jgi:hypothetical protein
MTDEVNEMSAGSRGSAANRQAILDGWIPVTERLPDEYEVVMVGWAGRRDIGKGYLFNGKWHDPLVCMPDVNQPTHWVPLPAPPTDGK